MFSVTKKNLTLIEPVLKLSTNTLHLFPFSLLQLDEDKRVIKKLVAIKPMWKYCLQVCSLKTTHFINYKCLVYTVQAVFC